MGRVVAPGVPHHELRPQGTSLGWPDGGRGLPLARTAAPAGAAVAPRPLPTAQASAAPASPHHHPPLPPAAHAHHHPQAVVPTFKLVLVGDGGVGKTTFVKRHLTGEFEKKYVATVGAAVHPMDFTTNRGKVRGGWRRGRRWCRAAVVRPRRPHRARRPRPALSRQLMFNVWDTAGQEKYAGLRDGY